MEQYQKDFVDFMLEIGALKFGEFTLKSGRISPYFFNAGAFNTGEHLSKLGNFYAQAIQASGLEFDVLFGPAYKGIPLATAVAMALNDNFNKNVPYSFNRKEAKTHGEGGDIVGHPLAGDILIIDDVITAGTAIREAMDIIDANGAKAKGVIVAVDRQEKGKGETSAIQEVEQNFGIQVLSIINLSHLVDYLKQGSDQALIKRIETYRGQYGV
ncbi:Orotate phosphoribosyltransferase (EC [uncultured Gammaproteobacteria bacterium]|jgi:orotate phosphoribosyltransferase|uniref:orotate phosphoribosyltransferase n=1 Tax=thiotrophic endosymbiont of Bathymodiolus puteoserpentis (Logatchev) TaxID=343240 RepID=UPI0010B491C6|nr:orotate phosphoribosyltransferase [thiotrophic endosymbiont of Bathymodiolus puteoserpentis (Logatchev)]CAC9601005.1 Orotate phosphoribosyltransferase (EC 2.4.2.10) [uncultured Gammaproteobacteria bacterium]CAC9988409.1 Orotate phosphoribosyltransferase (EC 2.4.2.10) [uncultured Gammaproteobacteria bacterium]CAC9996908.1 Orotate phosphoribosyltransferase (EC 2.4.2.10) [uncultured Gammaproteobacteria bacterium]SSC10784.1 Orotate phosphoribosyltransferase [thiotrophic endosymbiont of Bathymodi